MFKPILKWVGGKTQIIEHLLNKFPKEIENYHEPFLGGGSVLFNLLNHVQEGTINVKNIYASDSNEALIYVYKNIQSNHKVLYNELQKIINEFNSINLNSILNSIEITVNRNPQTLEEAKISKESYYYFIRKQYNSFQDKKTIITSAYFIFLNKTCFRGLYRVGPNGFNVPYGNNKNPEIINEKHLEDISNLIQCVTFEHCDFTDSLKKVNIEDFVYLDPPYVPVNKDSFVDYTLDGFNETKHKLLFNCLKTAKYRYLMSNSNHPLIKEQFGEHAFYETITAKRSINSKNPDSIVNELLVFN